MSWSKNRILSRTSRTAAVAANTNTNPPAQARAATQTTGAIFPMTSSQLYVSVVTLPINDKDSKEHFLGTNIYLKLQQKHQFKLCD